jgi:HrpA-like RNA helicase
MDSDRVNAGKRHRAVPIDEATTLPIAAFKRAIIDTVRSNRVLVLVGATGSGKTTQLPAYLYRAGILSEVAREAEITTCAAEPGEFRRGRPLQLVVTQPRRVAAITIARRVAQELQEPPPSSEGGGAVGYSVRFDDATGPGTRIKFATDGMLLRCVSTLTALQLYSIRTASLET